jgi:hypothetical protein
MSDQRPDSPGESTEAGSVLGQLWDIVRYAPIAIVLDGPALLPKLAEQGKVHMGNARVLGARAVRQCEPQVRRLLEDVGAQAAELIKRFAVPPDNEAPPAPTRPSGTRPVRVTAEPAASRNGETPAIEAGPAVADLAIPDYDSLPAAHVLNRLPGLSPEELEAVRRYETGHRGRKTILNKVAQIQQAS